MKQKSNITSLPSRESVREIDDKSIVSSLSPREIVSELDRYVIGQKAAKAYAKKTGKKMSRKRKSKKMIA